MSLEISDHARERMAKYDIGEDLVDRALREPSLLTEGCGGRKIYQLRLNGYVLRVIVEEDKGIKRVITVYKARSERYGL